MWFFDTPGRVNSGKNFFGVQTASVIHLLEYCQNHETSGNIVNTYHTRTIITRGLYTFYPIFEVQKHFFKDVFSESPVFMYG